MAITEKKMSTWMCGHLERSAASAGIALSTSQCDVEVNGEIVPGALMTFGATGQMFMVAVREVGEVKDRTDG